MALLNRLRDTQRREVEERARRLEARRLARIAKKVARDAAKADGLADLPLDGALAIESNPAPAKPEPASAATTADDSVQSLVSRLTAIRERIWRLRAMFAV